MKNAVARVVLLMLIPALGLDPVTAAGLHNVFPLPAMRTPLVQEPYATQAVTSSLLLHTHPFGSDKAGRSAPRVRLIRLRPKVTTAALTLISVAIAGIAQTAHAAASAAVHPAAAVSDIAMQVTGKVIGPKFYQADGHVYLKFGDWKQNHANTLWNSVRKLLEGQTGHRAKNGEIIRYLHDHFSNVGDASQLKPGVYDVTSNVQGTVSKVLEHAQHANSAIQAHAVSLGQPPASPVAIPQILMPPPFQAPMSAVTHSVSWHWWDSVGMQHRGRDRCHRGRPCRAYVRCIPSESCHPNVHCCYVDPYQNAPPRAGSGRRNSCPCGT